MREKTVSFAVLFFFVFLSYVSSQGILDRVFFFHLIVYRNDTVTLTDFEIIDGVPTDFPTIPLELNYSILILSTQNDILFRAQLPVSFTAYPMPPEGEPEIEVELNESEHYLRLPYFTNADRIEIYHDTKLIFQYNIPREAVCGDNVCETDLGEKYVDCPQDCSSGSKDNFCDGVSDGICDPDCLLDQDLDCVRKPRKIWVYILIGIIVFILLVVFFMKIKGERIEESQHVSYQTSHSYIPMK